MSAYERVMYSKETSYIPTRRFRTKVMRFESWEVKRLATNDNLGFIHVFSLPDGAGSDIELLPKNWCVV